MMNRYIFTLILSAFFVPLSLFAEDKDNEKTLTNISVAEDSLITKFSIGDSITFNTSFDSICGGFRERIIESGTKNILYEAFNSIKNEKGEWVLKFYEDVVLQKEHTYTLEIEGHEVADNKSKAVGKVSVIYRGNGDKPQEFIDDYEYSNIEYASFTVKDGGELNNYRLNFVSIEFSGEVTIDTDKCIIIDEDGKEHPFETIKRITNLQGCWYQFNIPLQLMLQSTESLTLHIYAKDAAGRAVKGNLKPGEYNVKGGNDHYVLRYKCELGYPALTISPKEGNYTSLKDFTFSNAQYIDIKNKKNEIKLLTSDGAVVASFMANDLVKDENNLSFSYSLEQAIDVEGKYTLLVPDSTFEIGTKKKGNKTASIAYEISNKLQMYGLESIDPNDGSEVETLSRIVLTFEEIAVPEYFNTQKISVTNDEGTLITYAKATIDANRDNDRQCVIVLDNPVTEPGNYHLNIPANAFALGKWGDHLSQKMTFDYTVKGVPPVVYNYIVSTETNVGKKLERVKIEFPELAYVDMLDSRNIYYREVMLTDTLDNEIGVGRLSLGDKVQLFVDSLRYIDSLKEELGEKPGPGKYRIHVPAGILILSYQIYEQEFVIDIDFDPTQDVNARAKEDNNYKLESVDLVFLNYEMADLIDSRTTPYQDVTLTDSLNNVIATARISLGRLQNNLLTVDNILTADGKKEKLGMGTYWLHVPANIMILDGEIYNRELVVKIEFYPSFNVDVEFYADANKKLDKVELTFPSFEVVDLKDSSTDQEMMITGTQDDLVATSHLNKGNQQNGLYLDNIRDQQGEKLGEGVYWLRVPAGTLFIDGKTYEKDLMVEIRFIHVAIDGQFAQKANGRARVYSAQGMLTRDEKDSEKALKGLPRGLYIINGKKVLVK